jgi:hypothetical protein
MLERHRRGLRPLPHARIDASVEAHTSSLGVVHRASIDFGFAPEEHWRVWLPRHEPAINVLVERLRHAAAGWRDEDAFLSSIVAFCPCTPPQGLVDDVLDRALPASMMMLGHSNLNDRDLWRLVDHVHEAGQTIALRRYCDPTQSPDRLTEVLHQLPTRGLARWLASSHITPSCSNKAERLARCLLAEMATSPVADHCRARWHPMVLDEMSRIQSFAG